MRTKIYILLGALVVSSVVIGQTTPLTLQQCIERALENNRTVKQKGLARKVSQIDYQQSKNDLLPDLNGSASHSYTFGRSGVAKDTIVNANSNNSSIGLSAGVTLYDGMKMKYNIDAKKANLNLAEATLKKAESDLVLNVSSVFLQVLLNKELLQIAKEQHELTLSKIEARKALIAVGKMAEGEIYELLSQESTEDMNKIKAEQTLNYSLLDLSQILEIEDFEKLDVVVPNDLLNVELQLLDPKSVYEGALIHRPEVKAAEYQLKGNEINVNMAKSAYLPTLSLSANSGVNYNNYISTPLSTNVGLSLRVPIFNKFSTRSQVKTAQLNVESSKLDMENTKIELRKTIQQSYQNALAAKARWDAAQKSEVASREAFRFVNQKYEAGRATVYELYQAKSNLTQVLSEKTQAKYEYVFRIKILELLK